MSQPQTIKKPRAKKTAKEEPGLIEITGKVVRKRFWNPDNGRCILAVELMEPGNTADILEPPMSFLGSMPSVREGDVYRFKGTYHDDPKWGRQFKFVTAEIIMPTGTAGVARYMSGITTGVGMAKAKRIVDALGEDCLERIQADPAVLESLGFLNETQRREIAEDLCKNSVQAELAGMICREGIGPAMVTRIYNQYGADSVRVVKENPYILSDELWGGRFQEGGRGGPGGRDCSGQYAPGRGGLQLHG